MGPKKFIKVDQRQRTNISNIYAIGDVVGGQLLAHKASREGIVAAETIAGLNSSSDRVAIPSAIFTDPEIATVGLSFSDLVEKKIEMRVGKFPFQANGRAMTATETEGFAKIIADKETGRILAAERVGEGASDIITEASLAIHIGA